jgi:hypothetical protein
VSISQLEPTPKGKDPYARELYSEPPLVVEGSDKYEIERLIDRKINQRTNIVYYLVRWKGWGLEYNV